MKKVALLLVALFLVFHQNLFAFNIPLEGKIVEEYYPAPIEKLLDKMVVIEDMVVGVYREYSRNLNKSKTTGNYLFEQISEALKDHHNLVCSFLKKKYISEKNPSKMEARLRKYFETKLLPEDKAAFNRFFQILPKTEFCNIQDLAVQAEQADKRMTDPGDLDAYVKICDSDPNFYRKVPFASLFNELSDKWENLVNKVREKVTCEDIIRFLDRAQQITPSDNLKKLIYDLKTRMIKNLVNDIEAEFSGLIENKLCNESITLIALQDNKSYIFKKSLLKGKLRQFVKKISQLHSLKDKPLFLSILDSLNSRIEALGKESKDPDVQKYVNMVCDTLKMNKLVGFNYLKNQDDPPELLNYFKTIGKYFADEDQEKYIPGIEKLF
ncbi:MAG: hypothetical protein HQM08_18295 [Candidatus Riflebacteria bacterium]|nr:hypothetical protein [Candidatus Riflebacteria bacterium]